MTFVIFDLLRVHLPESKKPKHNVIGFCSFAVGQQCKKTWTWEPHFHIMTKRFTIPKVYLKIHSSSVVETHHDVTIFEVDGIV